MTPSRTDAAAWAVVGSLVAGAAGFAAFAPPRDDAVPHGPDITTIDVDIRDMRFVPDTVEVAPGTKLVVRLTNSDDTVHDLKLGDGYSGRVEPGKQKSAYFGEFDQDTQGWCTIAGHKKMGMVFTLDVQL